MEMSGFLQGTQLGKYELLECIGQGGMADVYRAKQRSAFDREVALKVMRADFTGDAPFRKRFLREAHAISRLSHPNILPLIEFGEENGTLYLVMPLVREGTLRDLLGQHAGPLSLEEVLPLFVPLCDAVQYAHQEGIIHRDIKPQNILLQRRRHALLADFGIARDRLDTRMTTTGVAIGSVEYMAPEQAEGRASVQSDIYSLGVVLYQLLTGVVPYAGSMPLEVLFKKANTPLPDPRRVNPRLSAELVEILQVALAPDPGERFATAEALGTALQQVGLTASPAPLFPPAANWPPIPPAPLVSDFATTRRVDRRPPPDQQSWGPPANTWAEDTTIPEEQWHHAVGNAPAEAPASASHSKPRYMLLVAALAFLALGITSIAYGRLGQDWLHPNAATTGAQQLTPIPGTPARPTSGPGPVGPVGTPPSQPVIPPPRPGETPTAQPATPAAPQPTETPPVQPTPSATPPPPETPTTQPTAPATPPAETPQPTPTAQPTGPATPQPTETPAAQPSAPPALPTAPAPPNATQGPGALPGDAPTPGTQP